MALPSILAQIKRPVTIEILRWFREHLRSLNVVVNSSGTVEEAACQ